MVSGGVAGNEIDDALVQVYRDRGLLTADGLPVHLPTQCPCAPICWANEPATRYPVHPADALSAPHVGPRYGEGRLVVVLENLRDWGGWDLGPNAKLGMRLLADRAAREIRAGRRMLFPNPKYRGTNVWYRAVVYATAWLACDGIIAPPGSVTRAHDPAALAASLDFIAIVQHVKCSPRGGRSDQNPAMWRECGPHVLAHELAVLRPTRVIVLGRGDNAQALRELIMPRRIGDLRTQTIGSGRRRAFVELETRTGPFGPVDVLVAPHPAAPGGTSRAITAAVRAMLEATAQARRVGGLTETPVPL